MSSEFSGGKDGERLLHERLGKKVCNMLKWLKEPFAYLVLQAAACFLLVTGLFGIKALYIGDAPSYVDFSWQSVTDVLSQSRTFGYPLLLLIVRKFVGSLDMLPQVQITIFLSGVLVFYLGLRAYGVGKWPAFFAASMLLYQRSLLEWVNGTMSDLPGLSMALMCVASLFAVTALQSCWIGWVGLAVTTFAAYQFRPAYLFLIPLGPLLGLILLRLFERGTAWRARYKRVLVGILMATLLPFITFATLRWIAVGHFGLVPFGGVSLSGITTQFLTRDIVRGLDEDLQPLALAVIETRNRKNLNVPEDSRMWPLVNFAAVYNRSLTEVMIPTILNFGHNRQGAADRFEARDVSSLTAEESMPVNDFATRLALGTLRARPGVHVLYFIKSFVYTISFTLYVNATITLLLLMLFFVYMGRSILRTSETPSDTSGENSTPLDHDVGVAAVIIVSGLFYLASVGQNTLAVAMHGRHLLASSALLPSALVMVLFYEIKRAGRLAFSKDPGWRGHPAEGRNGHENGGK